MTDDENIFSEKPVGIDPALAEMLGKKSLKKTILRFFKKTRWLFIALAILGLIVSLFYFLLPEISLGDTKVVNLNTEFKLEKNIKASLKDGKVTVEIVNFVDDVCPIENTCFWSGQAVQYTMTIDGKKYATGSVTKSINTAFEIETVSSDYKTYANIKIIKK